MSQKLLLRLEWHTFELALAEPFVIAHEARTTQPTMIVALHRAGQTGLGEATATRYYGLSLEAMVRTVEGVRELVERPWATPEALWERLAPALEGHSFELCAIDVAAHDLHARLQGLPLWRLWQLDPAQMPLSSYTIGMGTPEEMVGKMRRHPWPVYKVKLGGKDDLALVRHLRKHTDAVFRLDANEAWTFEQACQWLPAMKDLGVEFVEQPLPRTATEACRELKRISPVPLIADESCQTEDDVARCADGFHGVNIKLMKCGGLTPARRMVAHARRLGLKVMVGCMTESSVGISAAAQLAPLLDYADLDGALLLARDIAEGVRIEQGRILLSDRPGTGARLLPGGSEEEMV